MHHFVFIGLIFEVNHRVTDSFIQERVFLPGNRVAEIHSIFLVIFSIVGTQGTLQTVTLQRPLVQQSKSPVNMPITLAPSGTVSAAVPSGGHVVTNIAPAPVAATATSKGLHSTAQTPGKNRLSSLVFYLSVLS